MIITKKILIIFFIAISSFASATKYYVSTSGNDINDGLSESTPWQTLYYAEANATNPGDIIALKKGDTWAISNVLAINSGGTGGNYIVWDGGTWGTGANAIIQSSNPTGFNSIVHIAGCDYLIFQNITVDANHENQYGIAIGGSSEDFGPTPQDDERYITIQNCSVLNVGDGTVYRIGILAQAWNNDMYNISVKNCTVDYTGAHGIAFYMGRFKAPAERCVLHNGYIGYNYVTNAGQAPFAANNIFLNDGIDSCIVEHNTIVQGTGECPGITIAHSTDDPAHLPRKIHVRYNDVRMTTHEAFTIYYGGDKSVDVYYNLFYCSNLNNGWAVAGIQPESYDGASMNFYNNVLIDDGSNATFCFKNNSTTAGVTTFRNNILVNTSTDPDKSLYGDYPGSVTTHSNNSFHRSLAGTGVTFVQNGDNFYTRSNVSSWEPTCFNTDPLFNDFDGFNFHLQTSSPLIGRGVAIPGITADFDGIPVSDPPNIGAFQGDGSSGNLTPGTIGAAQSICYNTAPSTLTQITAPTGGTGTYTFQWQSSTDNSTWTNITGATLSGYSPPNLSVNTYFRRRVSSGSYSPVNSSSVLITVYANLTSGSIGTAQSLCYNTAPATLTQLTAPAGGTGTYTYQWQSSADNSTWTNISGGTATGYSPPVLISNTYYRRRVTSGSCGTVNSASILITIYPQITLAQLHDDISIGNNTYTYFNVDISGGTSPFVVNYTLNGVPQSTINNYTSSTDISTNILTTGSYIYALTSVTDKNGCAAQNLGTDITITVVESGDLTPGSIREAQSVCYNTAPDPLTELTAPGGGTGTFSYQWQSSLNNSSWANIAGATLSGYSPPTLKANTYFRRTVTSGTYNPVNSSPILITVYPEITLAQLHDDINIMENTSTNFSIDIEGGTSPFTINYTRNDLDQSTIDNYTSGTEISTEVLTASVYIYALTSVIDANNCEALDLGTNITIRVSGLISGVPNVFTPNGDGINETWDIPSIQNFPDAIIRIYDRNLKQIIEYTGSDPEWDGRDSNGNPLSAGSYLYIIDLNNGTRPMKGYISLVK